MGQAQHKVVWAMTPFLSVVSVELEIIDIDSIQSCLSKYTYISLSKVMLSIVVFGRDLRADIRMHMC